MFTSTTRAFLEAVLCGCLALAGTAQAVPPGDTLLPATTKAFVSIPNADKLSSDFEKTQFSRLLDDPAMKPFGDDIRRQIKEKWTASHLRIGLTLDDLEGLAGGELSLAIVEPAQGKAAVVVLVDVTGNEEKAAETIEQMTARLVKQGAKHATRERRGVSLTILESVPKGKVKTAAQSVYFLKDGLLAASDNLAVAEAVVDRLAGQKQATLAESSAYRAVMRRCGESAGEAEPDARWFIEPLGLAEALRTWQDHRPKGGTDYVKVLQKQGFAAVQGLGGYVHFAAGSYDLLHRTFVYAPKPYELAMRMLEFPNGGDFRPHDWVSHELASYTTFQCDLLNAFDRFGSLFDEIYAEEGVWEDTLKNVAEDEDGPQIDLRRDLVAHLGQRVTLLTDYTLPITPTSPRRVLAIAVKNPKAVAAVIEKSFKNDPTAKRRVIAGHVVWEIINDDEDGRDDPGEAKRGRGGRKPVKKPIDEEADEENTVAVGLPNSAVTVALGHFFIASHIELLERALGEIPDNERLAEDDDYQTIVAEFGKLGMTSHCGEGFTRLGDQFHATYELFRSGRLPEADTPVATLLNLVLGEEKEGVLRKPQFDGSKLPDFGAVRHYLGPAGSVTTSEDDGWFAIGFVLGRPTPLAGDVAPGETIKH